MGRDLTIRVSLIEDDETIREGFRYLINDTEGLSLIHI